MQLPAEYLSSGKVIDPQVSPGFARCSNLYINLVFKAINKDISAGRILYPQGCGGKMEQEPDGRFAGCITEMMDRICCQVLQGIFLYIWVAALKDKRLLAVRK